MYNPLPFSCPSTTRPYPPSTVTPPHITPSPFQYPFHITPAPTPCPFIPSLHTPLSTPIITPTPTIPLNPLHPPQVPATHSTPPPSATSSVESRDREIRTPKPTRRFVPATFVRRGLGPSRLRPALRWPLDLKALLVYHN